MHCPKFIDFTRECLEEIKIIPNNTFKYCTTKKHKDCPFFRILNNEKGICEHVKHCYFFNNFEIHDFDGFAKISDEYCTGENHEKCKRYILSKKGEKVPNDLSPEGMIIKNIAS